MIYTQLTFQLAVLFTPKKSNELVQIFTISKSAYPVYPILTDRSVYPSYPPITTRWLCAATRRYRTSTGFRGPLQLNKNTYSSLHGICTSQPEWHCVGRKSLNGQTAVAICIPFHSAGLSDFETLFDGGPLGFPMYPYPCMCISFVVCSFFSLVSRLSRAKRN